MSNPAPFEPMEVDAAQVHAVAQRARSDAPLDAADRDLLASLAETYVFLTALVASKDITIAELRRVLGGFRSERSRDVLGPEQPAAPEDDSESPPTGAPTRPDDAAKEGGPKKKRKGHGRNGANHYSGAERVPIAHESLQSGSTCPSCEQGKVYPDRCRKFVRFRGQVPITATIYEGQQLRCRSCNASFEPALPPEAGDGKYDATVASMIGVSKYGNASPFYRQAKLQRNLGIALPASTMWSLVKRAAMLLYPIWKELIRQAAQDLQFFIDDTRMMILELHPKKWKPPDDEDEPKRKAVVTSAVVTIRDGRTTTLFFTGHRHAGENLGQVLSLRDPGLEKPLQMSDALSANTSAVAEEDVVIAHCLVHARRNFVKLIKRFPAESSHVIKALGSIYRFDAIAKKQGMDPSARLRYHQQNSAEVMQDLEKWLRSAIAEKRVEPNSALGEAIQYMTKRWDTFTRFLSVEGAPLDNNLSERVLKKPIIHRKNSLFYKSIRGALVGDIWMTLIHTAEINGVNAFEYVTCLQRYAKDVEASPADWMPWNYRDTLLGRAVA